MTPVEKLLAKLSGVKKNRTGWTARCPAHEDRTPSLSVSEGDDGRALVKCHAGCKVEAVAGAIDLRLADLMPAVTARPKKFKSAKPKAPAPESPAANAKAPSPNGRTFRTATAAIAVLERGLGKPSASWLYSDAEGKSVGIVIRWDFPDGSKTFRPVARTDEGWRIRAMASPRPLYHLPDLADAERILVVEGEKAADAARSLGFSATTSSGGAEAPHATDWEPLAGKEVWILPDNDDPGRKYAAAVKAILADLTPAPIVKVVELPDLPAKGDIVDWIEAQADRDNREALRQRIEKLASAVEPMRPVVSDDSAVETMQQVVSDDSAFRPFPVDALPDPLRQFVVVQADSINCDPSFLAVPLLCACASAIGSARVLKLRRGWYAKSILWGCVVGESGAKKTPAFDAAMKPLRDRQNKSLASYAAAMEAHAIDLAKWTAEMNDWTRSKKRSGEPPIKPQEPVAERCLVADATFEALIPILRANPRGLLNARDELNAFFGGMDRYARGKGSDAANYLSLYNGGSITNDRKTGPQKNLSVPNAFVSIVGGIQPEVLKRVLGVENRENGMAARFPMACPPRREWAWTEEDENPEIERALESVIENLFELAPERSDGAGAGAIERPVVVELTQKAKELFIAYCREHAAERKEMTGDLAAAWSKLEETAARLALVLHCVKLAASDEAGTLTSNTPLSAETMASGITLAQWFKTEARRIYAMFDESEGDRDTRKLVEWLRSKGGSATANDARRGCRWLKGAGAAEIALEELARAGLGEWENPATTTKGGQPGKRFTLANYTKTLT